MKIGVVFLKTGELWWLRFTDGWTRQVKELWTRWRRMLEDLEGINKNHYKQQKNQLEKLYSPRRFYSYTVKLHIVYIRAWLQLSSAVIVIDEHVAWAIAQTASRVVIGTTWILHKSIRENIIALMMICV